MKDLYHNLAIQQALAPQVATSSKTSAAIDLQGFESATVVFALGASGDTLSGSLYWTLTLEHSDASGSGYETVPASALISGAESVVIDAPAEDELAVSFGYVGTKRYLKAVATATGSHSNGTPMAMIALKGNPGFMPAA